MREIASLEELINSLRTLDSGILIGVPKCRLEYTADFFVFKKYQYKRIICSAYNREDDIIGGFSSDFVEPEEEAFRKLNFYHFEDLTEFCNWYSLKDSKLNQSINEFIEETDKFYKDRDKAREEFHKINTEMIQDESNLCSSVLPSGTTIMWAGESEFHPIKRKTRRDQLKDVIKLLKLNSHVEMLERLHKKQQSVHLLMEWKEAQEELTEWLDEEV